MAIEDGVVDWLDLRVAVVVGAGDHLLDSIYGPVRGTGGKSTSLKGYERHHR
jgi:hypothetical protein